MKILPVVSGVLLLALAAAAPARAQALVPNPPSVPALDRAQTDLQLQQEQRQLNSLGPQPGTAAEQQRLNQLKIQNQQPPLPSPNANNGLDQTLQNEQMQLRLREEQNRINQLPAPLPPR
jgi:hypothetical protein